VSSVVETPPVAPSLPLHQRFAVASLAIGLVVEITLAVALTPVSGAGAERSFGAWLLASLMAGGGAGMVAWFVRWLASELVLAWLMYRMAMTLLQDGTVPPGLAGRWVPYLATLVLVAVLIGLPLLLLMAAGLPWWLVPVLAAWPLARLCVARQAVMLRPVSAWGALAMSWRLTHRRELFAAGWTLVPLLPLAMRWLVVYFTAAWVPERLQIVWWLTVMVYWAYLPTVAVIWLALWYRLVSPPDEVDQIDYDGTDVGLSSAADGE
jgi:hypothetical protein